MDGKFRWSDGYSMSSLQANCTADRRENSSAPGIVRTRKVSAFATKRARVILQHRHAVSVTVIACHGDSCIGYIIAYACMHIWASRDETYIGPNDVIGLVSYIQQISFGYISTISTSIYAISRIIRQ